MNCVSNILSITPKCHIIAAYSDKGDVFKHGQLYPSKT